jgi:proteasome lid subunit RPN8/RPN11
LTPEFAVARAVIDAVVSHARSAAPDECCGLLLGAEGRVVDARPARNAADDARRRYVLDPKDHFDGRRDARARGLDVIGFYHSHPRSPAAPSESDRAEATYDGHLYLIVGLAAEPPEVALYRVERGNFLEVRFVTVA